MFTGIVERSGTVLAAEPRGEATLLRVDLGPLAADARAGDSIALNGCCLTLTGDPAGGAGAFEAVRETLSLTNLGDLRPGSRVHLARARGGGVGVGGLFVLGLVEGVGPGRPGGGGAGDWVLSVAAPPAVLRNLLHKGSVAVDGVSLTVASLDPEGFTVALIPHTLEVTTFGALRPGSRVNLEADLIGKWVRRILEERGGGGVTPAVSTLTREILEAEGFA